MYGPQRSRVSSALEEIGSLCFVPEVNPSAAYSSALHSSHGRIADNHGLRLGLKA